MIEAIKKIWGFSKKEQRILRRSIIHLIIKSLFQMLSAAAIYFVIYSCFEDKKPENVPLIALGLVVLSVAGVGAFNYTSQLDQTHVGYCGTAQKRISIAEKLKTAPMGFITGSTQERLVATETTVLSNVEINAPIILVTTVSGLILSLTYMVFALVFEWRIGLVALITIAAYLLILSAMDKSSRAVLQPKQEADTALITSFLEFVNGISVVKTFGLGSRSDSKVRNAIKDNSRRNAELDRAFTKFFMMQSGCLVLGTVAIVLISCLLYTNDSITVGRAIFLVCLSFFIFADLNITGMAMSMLRVISTSIDEADRVENMPSLDIEGAGTVPSSCDIEFRDVHFSYSDEEVIKGVSFKVPAKTSLAIVGYSGSGKTTICSLLARFWDVSSGQILLGGRDIKEYSLETLMDQMSIVFQDVYLFDDTVENNIKFGVPGATHEMVVEAARKAACLDLINSLPEKFDTRVGEGGQALSGGEKQRISIARCILKDAPVIILDEATASVDAENESKLLDAINELTHEKTVIIVAHRLKTVRNADNIIVIDDGQIAEQGSHDQLIQRDGIYKRFVNGKVQSAGWKI